MSELGELGEMKADIKGVNDRIVHILRARSEQETGDIQDLQDAAEELKSKFATYYGNKTEDEDE